MQQLIQLTIDTIPESILSNTNSILLKIKQIDKRVISFTTHCIYNTKKQIPVLSEVFLIQVF